MEKKAQTALIILIIILIIVVIGIVVIGIGIYNKPTPTGNAINIPSTKGQDVVCNSPYIRVGTDCCLDKNNNNICDKDEQQQVVTTTPISTPKQPSTPILKVHSINFNEAINSIEVTYKSESSTPLYLKGMITLKDSNGNILNRVGDIDSSFLSPYNYKTFIYTTPSTNGNNMRAEIAAAYGETPQSLVKTDRNTPGIVENMDVGVIDFIDRCKFSNVESVIYDSENYNFIIKINNNNPIGCYVNVELNDITVGNSKMTISTDNSVFIPAGKIEDISLRKNLYGTDLDSNQMVKITLYSGENRYVLTNILSIDKIQLQH